MIATAVQARCEEMDWESSFFGHAVVRLLAGPRVAKTIL